VTFKFLIPSGSVTFKSSFDVPDIKLF